MIKFQPGQTQPLRHNTRFAGTPADTDQARQALLTFSRNLIQSMQRHTNATIALGQAQMEADLTTRVLHESRRQFNHALNEIPLSSNEMRTACQAMVEKMEKELPGGHHRDSILNLIKHQIDMASDTPTKAEPEPFGGFLFHRLLNRA